LFSIRLIEIVLGFEYCAFLEIGISAGPSKISKAWNSSQSATEKKSEKTKSQDPGA
jgi:hypothetical protein